jgi:hypothetical protein
VAGTGRKVGRYETVNEPNCTGPVCTEEDKRKAFSYANSTEQDTQKAGHNRR